MTWKIGDPPAPPHICDPPPDPQELRNQGYPIGSSIECETCHVKMYLVQWTQYNETGYNWSRTPPSRVGFRPPGLETR